MLGPLYLGQRVIIKCICINSNKSAWDLVIYAFFNSSSSFYGLLILFCHGYGQMQFVDYSQQKLK